MPEINLPTAGKQSTILNTIGNPNPTTSDKSNVMNFLNKIHDTQLPKGGLKPVLVAGQISTNNISKVLDITGSGFLRKAVVVVNELSNGNGSYTIRVTVDDVVVMNVTDTMANSSVARHGIGFADVLHDANNIQSSKNVYAMSYSGLCNKVVSYNVGTPITETSAVVVLNRMKIPFNESLLVEMIASGTSATRAYEVNVEVY